MSITATLLAATPLKVTMVALTNPEPLIVTDVPPFDEPVAGAMPVTVGVTEGIDSERPDEAAPLESRLIEKPQAGLSLSFRHSSHKRPSRRGADHPRTVG